MKRKILFFAVAVSVGILLNAITAHAMPGIVKREPMPITRLVENLSRYVKRHPKDPAGYYTLARVHSLAFAQSVMSPAPTVSVIRGASGQTENQIVGHPTKTIEVVPTGSTYHYGNPELPVVEGYGFVQRDKPDASLSEEDLSHVRESVRYYAKATALAPKDNLCWLGFGWMLEQGAPYAAKLGTPWDKTAKSQSAKPSEWLDKALSAYRRVYDNGAAASPKVETRNFLSEEAGESILRIQSLPGRNLTRSDELEIKRMRIAVEKIKKKTFAVSPIILPLGHLSSLGSLLARNKSVTFDIAGDGSSRRWPWVSANTGILVWDPHRTGTIDSGRQLFGSVTWWIFWKNGYEPLAALDDDGDGLLQGRELDGISVWRDANGNGISEKGEVRPLADWNITALAARAMARVEGVPENPRGFQRDGAWLPTYDWTPRAVN